MCPWEGVSEIRSIKDIICTVEGSTGQLPCLLARVSNRVYHCYSTAVRMPLVKVGLKPHQVTCIPLSISPCKYPQTHWLDSSHASIQSGYLMCRFGYSFHSSNQAQCDFLLLYIVWSSNVHSSAVPNPGPNPFPYKTCPCSPSMHMHMSYA